VIDSGHCLYLYRVYLSGVSTPGIGAAGAPRTACVVLPLLSILGLLLCELDAGTEGELVGSRLNQPRRTEAANEQQLKGISRLVNPKPGEPELVSGEEDQGERDYLGHILRVADEALDAKGTRYRPRRRGRPH
jgi:hypothetical protein